MKTSVMFKDGPAAGEIVYLEREPILLRVTQSPRGWDALDQIDDTPAADETVYVYVQAERPTTAFVDYQDKAGRRHGEAMRTAAYALSPAQPGDSVLRDNEAWRAWCRGVGMGLLPEHAKGLAVMPPETGRDQ
jgi:hypothetical protein